MSARRQTTVQQHARQSRRTEGEPMFPCLVELPPTCPVGWLDDESPLEVVPLNCDVCRLYQQLPNVGSEIDAAERCGSEIHAHAESVSFHRRVQPLPNAIRPHRARKLRLVLLAPQVARLIGPMNTNLTQRLHGSPLPYALARVARPIRSAYLAICSTMMRCRIWSANASHLPSGVVHPFGINSTKAAH